MTIPQGYLSKKGGRWRKLKLTDVLTLLFNILEGARNKEVGFEDTRETIETITRKLNKKRVWIDPSVLESALWSCNLMNENEGFWDARGLSFDEFVKQILEPGEKFHRVYNTIDGKDSK